MSLISVLKNGDGKSIHSIYVRNLRPIGDGKYFYQIEYSEYDGNKNTFNFDVIHDRENGASGLMHLIYEKIDDILNK